MEIEENVMIQTIKKRYKESFLGSLLLAIFAIILLLNPDNFMSIFIQVIGYASLFLGMISIVSYFRLGKTERLLSRNLQNGIFLCVFGCTTFMKTIMIKDVITLLLGGYLVFRNASRVQMSLYLGEDAKKVYIWLLVLSLINVFIGFLVIINPFENIGVNLFLGTALLITEFLEVIQNLIVMFLLKSRKGE